MGLFDRAKPGNDRPPTVEELRERLRELRRVGGVEEAWRLIYQEFQRRPQELEIGRLLWEVAVTCDRSDEAAPALMRCIQQELRAGQNDVATFHYFELIDRVGEDYPVDLDTRIRLGEALRAGGQEEEAAELLAKIHEQVEANTQLPARFRAARVAAWVRSKSAGFLCPAVLADPNLPEPQKRELATVWAEAQQKGLRVPKAEVRHGAPIELSVEAAAPRRLQVIPAIPYDVDGEKIGLDLGPQGGRRRMALAAVQAISCARIDDGRVPAYIVVDLLLDSLWVDKEVLRTVRLRTLDFDPRSLVADSQDPQLALISVLENLLAVSQAQPLPDPEGARGRPFHGFASLREYESTVLGVVPG